jgi:hypothetical protein
VSACENLQQYLEVYPAVLQAHTETKLVLEAHAKMWFCRFVWWLVVLTFNTTSSLLVKPSSILSHVAVQLFTQKTSSFETCSHMLSTPVVPVYW